MMVDTVKSFKLVIPAEEELPRKLRITLPGLDDIEVEINFQTVNNRRVVNVELDSEATTTLNESDDRTTELLSQIDIDSSGGFIPPDIARQLDDVEDGDDVVDASQYEEDEEPVESVIPGLYSPPRTEAREHLMESSFEDDCFVPATQQRKLEKNDSDDDAEAVVLSSDEEPEEEVNPELTTVVRAESHSPSGHNRRTSSKDSSPPKVVEIDDDPDEDAEPNQKKHDVAKNAESDSGDSFAGEPMLPESQPVEPIVKKKFVKKRNVVVLSSDDEEDDPIEKVQKSLPDLETEPPALRDECAKNLESTLIVRDASPEPTPAEEAADEVLEKSAQESPDQNEHPGSPDAPLGGDCPAEAEKFDEDAEILTGVQIVEDTQNQTSPKPSTSRTDQNLSDEKLEIPETEEQRNVSTSDFKTPLPADRRPVSSPETRTQESLRLTLLSESDKMGTPSQAEAPGRDADPGTSTEGDGGSESNQDAEQHSASTGTGAPNIPEIDFEPKRSRNSFLEALGLRGELRESSSPPGDGVSDDRLSSDPERPLVRYLEDEAYAYVAENVDLALTDCPPCEYVVLRSFQQYPSVATRREKVAEWLAQTPGGFNEEYAGELRERGTLEAVISSFTNMVEPISPIITTGEDRDERKTKNAAADGYETPSRKRSFPGPDISSPEKRHRNILPVSSNQESPPTVEGAESKSPRGSSPKPAAGGDGNQRGNCENDEKTEHTPTEGARARRRRLYNSQDEATQRMAKIVDSQEVENFALPPASRNGERTPKTSTRRSARRNDVDANSKPETPRARPVEGPARSTRRTRASRSDDTEKSAGISVKVETRPKTTPSRTSKRSTAAAHLRVLETLEGDADEETIRRRQTEYDLRCAQKVAHCYLVLNSAKTKAHDESQNEVLVAETVPDEKVDEKPAAETNEVEETPVQSSSESLPRRRTLRPRNTRSSESSKTELPDPYAKDTIEVDPPVATRKRTAAKKSESSELASGIQVEFSEEINPELIEGRPLRTRQQLTGPGVRASRVRSLSNLVGKEQSIPKRSRLIRKSSSSITVSMKAGGEIEKANGKGGDDPNSSINGSIASSDSSLGLSRMAKARVMFTGIENPPREEVLKLGLKLTDIISQCNVVVAAKFTRTVKMMYAMAKGIPVVSSSWILESSKAKKVLGIENYMLRDEVAEKRYNFSLVNTLRLAGETKFFKGWNFYVTKSCSPNAEQLGEMISGCEAKVLARIPMKFAENTVIVTCPADRKLLPKKPPVPVVSVEFVFHGILQHEVDFEAFEVK